MKSRGIATLLVFFGMLHPAFSQVTGYRLYTVADGLVESEVICLHQDKMGFLWAGTKNGISRFDGHTFLTVNDSAHIARALILFTGDLNDSTVAIVTAKGTILYEYGRTGIRIYSIAGPSGNISGYWIYKNKLQLAVTRQDSLVLYETSRTGFRRINDPVVDCINRDYKSLFPFGLVRSMTEGNLCFIDSAGRLCIATNTGLTITNVFPNQIFSGGEDKCLYYFTPPDYQLQPSAQDGCIRFLELYHKDAEPLKMFKITGTRTEFIRTLGTASNFLKSHPFIRNDSDILFTDYGNRSITHFTKEKTSVFQYDINLSGTLFTDREGNFWLGSPLGLIRSMPVCFSNYTEKQGLFPNGQFVAEDQNRQIVTGSYNEGFQLLKNGRFVHIPFPSNGARKNENRIIYPVASRNHRGEVILAAFPNTAIGWNGEQLFDIPGLPESVAFSYYDDFENNREYFGILTGLFSMRNRTEGKLIQVTPGNKSNKIVSIVKDANGRLLIGGFHGLSMIEGDQVRHLPDPVFPFSLGANAMLRDHRRNIWIGNSDGLFLFDNRNFRKIFNPWFNDLVLSLCQVDTATLFIGGLRGIGFLDLKRFYRDDTTVIRFFNRDNGFSGMECQQNAVTRDHSGNIWIGATSSIVKIDPRNLPSPAVTPCVYITGVSAVDVNMKQTSLFSSVSPEVRLHLTHDCNNLHFTFTGIWFSSPERLHFRYMLKGYESGWSETGSQRSAVYTNLSPGTYVFQVEAINDQGVRSEFPAIVRISIQPAIWQTWWFWGFVFLLTISITVLITWLISKQIRLRQQKELENQKTIAELRFKSLKNQLAPHFIFNALNAIGSSVFQQDNHKTYDLLLKFSRLIRHSLTHAENSSTTLAEELTFVQHYLEIEKIRFENRIRYEIILSPDVRHECKVPRMIIQTFVENAVKHGLMHKQGEGMIRISVRTENESLSVVIEDDGIGREAATAFKGDSTGKGMEIIREFIRLFNSFNELKIAFELTDLFHADGKPAGTRVHIRIPLTYSYSLHHEVPRS